LCPNGQPNRPGTRNCVVCLALIAPAEIAPPPEPAAVRAGRPRRRRPRKLWLLLSGLLLLGLVSVAAFLYFYPRSGGGDYLATAAVVTLPAALPASVGGTPALAAVTAIPLSPTPPAAAAVSIPPLPAVSPTFDPDASPTPVATITPLSTTTGNRNPPTAAPGATPLPGLNLLQNGDFRDDWINGWERATSGLNGATVVETRLLAGAPPQPTLYMGKSGPGALLVQQHVVLTGPAADLAFQARVRLAGMAAGMEGRAALVLLYENAAGEPLGASVWLDGSRDASALWGDALPASGPTTVARYLGSGWQTIAVDLRREFSDWLPGIDPEAVRRVTVQLTLGGSSACPPEACSAELNAAELSLATEE
jgi:hypothetical protein